MTVLMKMAESSAKGWKTCYEQFLLFPECFEKTCTADMLEKKGLFGKGLKRYSS